MAAMISGATRRDSPCLNGRDDDEDGLFDLEDQGVRESTILKRVRLRAMKHPPALMASIMMMMASSIILMSPVVSQRVTLMKMIHSTGRPARMVLMMTVMEADYPFDPGCFGRGDPDERDALRQPAAVTGGMMMAMDGRITPPILDVRPPLTLMKRILKLRRFVPMALTMTVTALRTGR